MAFQDITPAQQETFQSLQIDGTETQARDINEKIDAALKAGLLLNGGCKGYNENGTVRWQVEILPLGEGEPVGATGSWFVASSLGSVSIMLDAVYQVRFGLPPA